MTGTEWTAMVHHDHRFFTLSLKHEVSIASIISWNDFTFNFIYFKFIRFNDCKVDIFHNFFDIMKIFKFQMYDLSSLICLHPLNHNLELSLVKYFTISSELLNPLDFIWGSI